MSSLCVHLRVPKCHRKPVQILYYWNKFSLLEDYYCHEILVCKILLFDIWIVLLWLDVDNIDLLNDFFFSSSPPTSTCANGVQMLWSPSVILRPCGMHTPDLWPCWLESSGHHQNLLMIHRSLSTRIHAHWGLFASHITRLLPPHLLSWCLGSYFWRHGHVYWVHDAKTTLCILRNDVIY